MPRRGITRRKEPPCAVPTAKPKIPAWWTAATSTTARPSVAVANAPSCGKRFTTYERVEAAALIVVKKDGRREEFNPDKLRAKLRVALTKRPVAQDDLDKLIAKVEADLMAMGTKEVSSHEIGEKVLAELKTLDHVAYIRFASVYRQFADIDDLRREVEGLSLKEE